MTAVSSFEDLEAWQVARGLTREIYRLSVSTPLKADFELRGQIRRAAISIMSNIAEGWERTGRGEKLQFYNYARASAGEVRSLTYVCQDAGYWDDEISITVRESTKSAGRLVSGLIRAVASR